MTRGPQDAGPFTLATVLEEEYRALHGPLPAGQPCHSEQERLTALYQAVHSLPEPRAALCLSGGGIRSATFGLGVLQSLARLSLLDRFDYLSTVSGGGYIGSWLTAWIHRHPRGTAGVAGELSRPPSGTGEPEPEPVTWLRQYSNYLSPRLGLLSVDSWTLLGTYLRNLTLNWLVLVPLLAAALLVPRLGVSLVRWSPAELGLSASLPGWLLGLGLSATMLCLTYFHLYRPGLDRLRSPDRADTDQAGETETRSIWDRFERQQWFLIAGLTPLLLAALSVTLAYAWYMNGGGRLEALAWDPLGSRGTFVLIGAGVHGAGWLLSALLLRRWRDLGQWQEFGRWLAAELLIILWSGALGGFLLWSVLTETPDKSPVAPFAEWYACFAIPGILTMFLLTATLFVGVASRYTDDHDREWWGRAGAWVLIAAATWSAGASLVLFGPGLASMMPGMAASLGGVSGLISLVLGFSGKTSASGKAKPSMRDVVLDRVVRLAAPVFIACLLTFLTVGSSAVLASLAGIHGAALEESTIGLRLLPDGWGHAAILHNSPPWLVIELSLSLVALAGVMSLVININKFSLHSIYRNRLIRAYLGASRLPEYREARRPNLFTGFDVNDNVQLQNLAPPGRPLRKPLHILNCAINLVRAENLAWQQRKAQSFTASPLFCGSWNLGYRRATRYGANERLGKAITLGTAMAISGAAASPNMGYHSAPAVTFLLAFFNVRLGWWMGNPGPAGDNTFDCSCPRIAVRPLLAEMFGLTDACNPYVYLSDGGHFENLGLYEMVLRRCRYIVVSDASCDTARAFTDLGNAIRKIRVDLGVEIEINPELLQLQAESRFSRSHYAIGVIRYDRVDPGGSPGLLVYLKPSLTGNEPADVTEYAKGHPEFPHEATADQFFDEAQFESYRALGAHIAHTVMSRSLINPTGDAERLFEEFQTGGRTRRTAES
ncbi:MAG TPA: patatin-like phospholipase family protein [Nitrospira sp.]|nr:patatin-like phospholipase family protein [Nitrospira sp.]